MRQRIFKGTFLVALLVWLGCLSLIFSALYIEDNWEYAGELKNEAYMAAHAVEVGDAAFFDGLKLSRDRRITWIDKDGTVLKDSAVEAESEMENHRNRPEVMEAFETGYGEADRPSRTLAQKTIYSAVRLQDGTVLRVSQTQPTVFSLIFRLWKELLLVLILAILLAYLLARMMAKRIVKPINEIDLDNAGEVKVYEEVQPLVDKIAEQKKELDFRINRLQVDVDEKTKEANFRKEFTANVSHELKTPLTSISGFAEIIKNGIVKEEDIPRFAERIYNEAQRLIVLVEDIIKLSQLDEKQISARKERLDLYLAGEDVLYMLEKAAEEKAVQLKLEGEHVYVEAVPQILSEILYNLCDNAIRYNKEHGTVTVSVFEENGRPAVRVADTGIGIPEKDLDRVFERFFRVDKSHSKEIGGTGLGLSIVKHGAAYHNAQIRIDSQLGQGTTISVIF